MPAPQNRSAALLERFRSFPGGLWLFSRLVCFKAPYFSSIAPTFTKLEAGFGEAEIRRKRKVMNHLSGVHAIAIANLCEFVAGTTLEITTPPTHRWIPKSMKIDYLAIARSKVTARTEIRLVDWPDSASVPVKVEAFDAGGKPVARAEIEMHVSRRK